MHQDIGIIRQGSFGTHKAFFTNGRRVMVVRIIKKPDHNHEIVYDKIANELNILRELKKQNNQDNSGNKLNSDYQVLPYYDTIYESPKNIYFIMDYFKFSLKYLFDVRQFSDLETAEIMSKCCEAVEHLHQANIAHGAISPSVFLIDENLNVLLHDYSCATIVNNDEKHDEDDEPANKIIELSDSKYIAVDILSKQRIDNQYKYKENDIYGLGVILLQMAVQNRHVNLTAELAKHRAFVMDESVYGIGKIKQRLDSVYADVDARISHKNLNEENITTMNLLDEALDNVGYISKHFVQLFKAAIHHNPTCRPTATKMVNKLQTMIDSMCNVPDPLNRTIDEGVWKNSDPAPMILIFPMTADEKIGHINKAVRSLINTYRTLDVECCDSATNKNRLTQAIS